MYTRAGELAALQWGDVDLEHGTMHVHKSIDRMRKIDVGSTKTETARRVPIEPKLLPLLRVLHKRAGGKGPVALPRSPDG
jgi:integrase